MVHRHDDGENSYTFYLTGTSLTDLPPGTVPLPEHVSAIHVGTLRPLDDSLLEEAVGYAVTASAITCTRRGAVPPSRAEIDAWIGTSQGV